MNNDMRIANLVQACARAVHEDAGLCQALADIYGEAFADTAQLPGANQLIARRIVAMQQEYHEQCASYVRGPRAWLASALRESREAIDDERALLRGVGQFLVEIGTGSKSEKLEAEAVLRCVAEVPKMPLETYAGLIGEMLANCSYGGAEAPAILPESIACTLSMAMYVLAKRGQLKNAEPSMTLDSLCVWVNTARLESDPPLAVPGMTVAMVMSCLYAQTPSWDVVKACATSLCALRGNLNRMLAALASGNAELMTLTDETCAETPRFPDIHNALIMPLLRALRDAPTLYTEREREENAQNRDLFDLS